MTDHLLGCKLSFLTLFQLLALYKILKFPYQRDIFRACRDQILDYPLGFRTCRTHKNSGFLDPYIWNDENAE